MSKSKKKKGKKAPQTEIQPLVLPDQQYYRNRYYAMFHIVGLSITLSLLWGFVRWVWLTASLSQEAENFFTTYLIPALLTGLHLWLCRHYIRAIHDSIEKLIWYALPCLSFVLFYSVGEYVEMRFSPFFFNDDARKTVAQIWQIVLLIEGLVLFFVYRSWYVVKEYEDSAGKEQTDGGFLTTKFLSIIFIFVIVPLAMFFMFLVTFSAENRPLAYVEYGSLHYSLVLVRGEWWRLMTHAFLHDGFFHLVSNLFAYYYCMLFLYLRHKNFLPLVVFLLSVFGSGVFVLYFSNYNNVGSSGGVFGLMTFWALDVLRDYSREQKANQNTMDPKSEPENPFKGELNAILPLLGINLVRSFGEDISTSGHFGGFFTGIVIWFLFRLWPALRWILTSAIIILVSVSIYTHRHSNLKRHLQKMEYRQKTSNQPDQTTKTQTQEQKQTQVPPSKTDKTYDADSCDVFYWSVTPGFESIPEYQAEVSNDLLGVESKDIKQALYYFIQQHPHTKELSNATIIYPHIKIILKKEPDDYPGLLTIMSAEKAYYKNPKEGLLMYKKSFALDLLHRRLLTDENVFSQKVLDENKKFNHSRRRTMVIPYFNEMNHQEDFVKMYMEGSKNIYKTFSSYYRCHNGEGLFTKDFLQLREAICKMDADDIIDIPLPLNRFFTPKYISSSKFTNKFSQKQVKLKFNKRTQVIGVIDTSNKFSDPLKLPYQGSTKKHLSIEAQKFIESQLH